MTVSMRKFGASDGVDIAEARIEQDNVSIALIAFGARVREWRVPAGGGRRNVVLGFERLEDYLIDRNHLGAITGRVANRIRGSRFSLGGRQYELPANEGRHHLHGGPEGFGTSIWSLEPDSADNSVEARHVSPAGHMGYPGKVEVSVVFRLDGRKLTHNMRARVSEPTPINIVQHHYFNLMGHGDVLTHRLAIAADRYTVNDTELIPTGEIAEVGGSPFDFRNPREIGRARTYDLNYVLRDNRDPGLPVAVLESPDRALMLKLWSDQPGLQFYNGAYLASPRYGGLCLEDQGFPDAVNQSQFPSIIVTPDAEYQHRCTIEIS